MSLTINNEALAKLETAFNYAQQVKQQESAGESSVIRIKGENFACQVSHADAPKGFLSLFRTRSDQQKNLNNETRALFKQTVLDALGVADEDKLPQSVKTAMKLSRYDNKGRPLTARRIIAVVSAIRNAMNAEPVDAAIKGCIKSNEIAMKKHPNDPMTKLEVTPQMRKQAISLLSKHASTFGPEARQVLANYAIFTLANCDDAKNIDEIIGTLAKKIAKLDDFEYGDERFEPLNTKLTEVYQEKLGFYMDPKRADSFHDGVSVTLYKDAYRAEFEINGKDPNAGIDPKDVEGRKNAVVPKFKEALPEKFTKPLSMFMCQDMGRITGELLCKRLALYGTGEEVLGTDYKGSELMPFSPNDGEIFDESSALTGQGNDLRYKLEVSKDKKTATITMEANYDLMFCVEGAGYEGYNTCGNIQYSTQFKFDLSGDELRMTSCHTSQHIDP